MNIEADIQTNGHNAMFLDFAIILTPPHINHTECIQIILYYLVDGVVVLRDVVRVRGEDEDDVHVVLGGPYLDDVRTRRDGGCSSKALLLYR